MSRKKRSFPSSKFAMAVVCALSICSAELQGQVGKHVRVGVVSDWSHHHVLFPSSKDGARNSRAQKDGRWLHDWYLHHPEAWWPTKGFSSRQAKGDHRDWNFSLGSVNYEPIYDFSYTINSEVGFGSLNTADQLNGNFLATGGSMTVLGVSDPGTYSLYPGGPSVVTSPNGAFIYDNLIYPPNAQPFIDLDGLLFLDNTGFEINLWGNTSTNYEFDDTGYAHDQTGSPFTMNVDPGGGQTSPAKYVFDVTSAPSCANDFVVIGIPATPASGGQANIVGLNNLYTSPSSGGFCSGAGPSVEFAYAVGTGEVPSDIVISQDGKSIAFIENLLTGSSYLHVLTIGTTGGNGISPTISAVPGSGNNAVDKKVLLSPDGGTTNQSSTTSPYVVYTGNDVNDVAYVSTYSTATGTGSGYIYKISNVFSGTPTIVWTAPVTAVPSSPVYDSVSNKVFFTDSNGRIDYIADSGSSPSVTYSSVLASGTTSENPVIVDSTNEMIYASFNSNGTNAVVIQAPTSLTSSVSVPVGTQSTTYTGPYSPDFNNAWYNGTGGTPLMYVAGTGSGTVPTLYSVGFNGSGVINSAPSASAALATGMADASRVTEFYNPALNKDYLFVSVTNNCVATTGGGTAGCIYSLDITSGFPTVNAGSTALAAASGTTGVTVDNDSSVSQASSIYYATKSGATLVKATQAGLN